eukprot:4043231-Ditylum_brightwellii.AAC.1
MEHKCNEGWMKLMQPVLLQTYEDEFELNQHGLKPQTSAETGSVLEREDSDEVLSKREHSKYWTGIGKLMHMFRWMRPETQNAVWECSKMSSFPTKTIA